MLKTFIIAEIIGIKKNRDNKVHVLIGTVNPIAGVQVKQLLDEEDVFCIEINTKKAD